MIWVEKVEIEPVLPVCLVVTLEVELGLRLSRAMQSDISSDDNIDRVSEHVDKSDGRSELLDFTDGDLGRGLPSKTIAEGSCGRDPNLGKSTLLESGS